MRLAIYIVFAFLTGVANADDRNTYISQMLGFKVTKPESWNFVSANTYLDQTKQMKLNDKELQQRWSETIRAPLVVITKYPASHPDVNTSFKADVKPYGQLPTTSSGVDILNVILKSLGSVFKNLTIEQSPIEITLANHKAGYMKISYVNVAQDGREYPSTSEMWVVPRKNHFFMLGGGYKRGDKAGPKELQSILTTLRIE